MRQILKMGLVAPFPPSLLASWWPHLSLSICLSVCLSLSFSAHFLSRLVLLSPYCFLIVYTSFLSPKVLGGQVTQVSILSLSFFQFLLRPRLPCCLPCPVTRKDLAISMSQHHCKSHSS